MQPFFSAPNETTFGFGEDEFSGFDVFFYDSSMSVNGIDSNVSKIIIGTDIKIRFLYYYLVSGKVTAGNFISVNSFSALHELSGYTACSGNRPNIMLG